MPRLVLDGPWDLRPVERFSQGHCPNEADGWLVQDLPAHWQQHPDLAGYAGRVLYRRRFQWPFSPLPDQRVWLRCNGIFYWSSVYLNGQHLGDHEGYFSPQEYEVSSLLRQGENELVCEVYCPDEVRKHDKRMITGVFSHWNVGDALANPGGIWLPVELYTTGPLHWRKVFLHTQEISPQTATLAGRLTLDGRRQGPATLRFTFSPENFPGEAVVLTKPLGLVEGETHWSSYLTVPRPQLWWTYDLGDPCLYRVRIECLLDGESLGETTLLFGIRRFELRDWIAYLNGRRLFIRGSNYPPGDMRIATMTPERYRQDIALAKGAHMNLLRLHAHVEHPSFYEVADREGLLVWQDFPLQWAYAREALPSAERQVAEMVALLGNHPSVVVWCMHNEPIWQEESAYHDAGFAWQFGWSTLRYIWNRFLYSWDRQVLDSRLKRVVERLDPSRPAIRASGEIALPLLRRGTDTHFYFGWYAAYGPKRLFEWVRRFFRRNLRFVTEFGAQSFPNEESLGRFLPARLEEVDWEEVARRYAFQPEVMALWLDWRRCRTWAELAALSQSYQSELNRYYIDRLRFHKYRPTGGIVTFNLVDPSPAVQWSVVDYWRVPKKSYEALGRAFSPTYLFTLLDHDVYRAGQKVCVPVYGVNDAPQDHQGRAKASLFDEAGRCLVHQEWPASLPADSPCIRLGRLLFRPEQAGCYRLRLELHGGTSPLENEYSIVVRDGGPGRRTRPPWGPGRKPGSGDRCASSS